jgi:hypothetical protein
MAFGAARCGNLHLLQTIVTNMNKRKITDFHEYIIKGAAIGGYDDIIEHQLSVIKKENPTQIINDHLIANWAAFGGHLDLAEKYLKKSINPSRHLVAEYAVKGGHQNLADYFLIKVDNIDYQKLVISAIEYGDPFLIDEYLQKIPEDQRNYSLFCLVAAENGHGFLVESYLKKMPKNQINYNEIAANAAYGGHQILAYHYLHQSHMTDRDYNRVAQWALKGGNFNVTDFFLNMIDEKQRDYLTLFKIAVEKEVFKTANTYLEKLKSDNQPVLKQLRARVQQAGKIKAVDYLSQLIKDKETNKKAKQTIQKPALPPPPKPTSALLIQYVQRTLREKPSVPGVLMARSAMPLNKTPTLAAPLNFPEKVQKNEKDPASVLKEPAKNTRGRPRKKPRIEKGAEEEKVFEALVVKNDLNPAEDALLIADLVQETPEGEERESPKRRKKM